MNSDTLFALLGVVASVGLVLFAWLGFRYTQRRDKQQDDTATIKTIIDQSLQPIKDSQAEGNTRMSVIETKVDMLWMNLQKDMARGIHSPDPRRAHIDSLMEKIINEEPMSQIELDETKQILHKMVDYEPGHSPDPGFPMKDGDPVFAAFLLRSFDVYPIPVHSGEK